MYKLLLFFLLIVLGVNAQDPTRFTNEIQEIKKKYSKLDTSKESIVFTGSSSIKYWINIKNIFPEHQIVNSGFGSSQASDLLYYIDELVLDYNPKKIFIYEGDNDINFKKKPRKIITDLKNIINKIKAKNSKAEIILISAKPSIARWSLKKSYLKLNRKMRRLSLKDETIFFADIWTPMLDGKLVRQDIFVGDNLHMNTKGYRIWHNVLKNYIN